jgi:ABC-type lipoprotein export system ATPase subunit
MGRPLLDFSRSTEDVLAITGPSGSGKSILAGWIVERLQKPLDKKMYETLSSTIGMLEELKPLASFARVHF